MSAIRHEFYETDERMTLSIFDKGADPADVQIDIQPRKFTYKHGEKELVLEPLKGQVDPAQSNFTVGKVKIEVRFVKMAHGRWGALVGDAPDPLSTFLSQTSTSAPPASSQSKHKNWDKLSSDALAAEKEKSTEEDPNVGGDSTVNSFFQKLFGDADEDTKRAMMKSYSESGGTTLSTNWAEVGKGKVEVKPPQGSEWKQWGA